MAPSDKTDSSIMSAPPPPPLPPALAAGRQVSKFALKVKDAPPDWFLKSSKLPPHDDFLDPKTGIYFFYGSLMDPKLLSEILQLDYDPQLRPACITGYQAKLWGQYPAMVDGEKDATEHGVAYDVNTAEHARRLAEYETSHYRTQPCMITYTDGKAPDTTQGRVFVFVGNPRDLTDGTFDLSAWLKQVRRE